MGYKKKLLFLGIKRGIGKMKQKWEIVSDGSFPTCVEYDKYPHRMFALIQTPIANDENGVSQVDLTMISYFSDSILKEFLGDEKYDELRKFASDKRNG